MIHFAWPYFFLLLPVPFFLYFILPKKKNILNNPLRFPLYTQCENLLKKESVFKKNHNLYWLTICLIWLGAILALSRPQWLGDIIKLPNTGRDLMLAIDISGSMETGDLTWQGKNATRLYVVKKVLNDFISNRQGDRIGLILFGSKAYQLSPLTMALNTTKTFLNEAMIGMAGNKTAIGDAIGLAIKRLIKRKAKAHVLILITDGVNTAGEVNPIKAALLAAKYHIKIYTIGVGANSAVVQGFFGSHRYNPSADLDEKTLQQIAQVTKGKYFRATNSQELQEIYKLIDQQEKISADPKLYRPSKELYMWPLGFSYLISILMIFLLLIIKLKNTRKVT